jgi:hypothetical protein
MDDPKLGRILNTLAVRCVLVECQVMALRGLLNRKDIIPDAEFDRAMALVFETYKEFLGGRKTDAERLEEFLRKFEGPIQ